MLAHSSKEVFARYCLLKSSLKSYVGTLKYGGEVKFNPLRDYLETNLFAGEQFEE